MKNVLLYPLLVVVGLIGIPPLAAQTQTATSTGTGLSVEAQIADFQAAYDGWDQPAQPIGPNEGPKRGSRLIATHHKEGSQTNCTEN